jgi:hypothetical protein
MSLSSLGAQVSCHRGSNGLAAVAALLVLDNPRRKLLTTNKRHEEAVGRGLNHSGPNGVFCYRHETTGGLHFVSDRSGGFRCALARVGQCSVAWHELTTAIPAPELCGSG